MEGAGQGGCASNGVGIAQETGEEEAAGVSMRKVWEDTREAKAMTLDSLFPIGVEGGS